MIRNFILILLAFLLFPLATRAQPPKKEGTVVPIDTCGAYILYAEKIKSPPPFYADFYLENTVTHAKTPLSMNGVYRYDFEHGFLVSYGDAGINIFRADSTPLVNTGAHELTFFAGDSLFAAYDTKSAWKIFSARGELLASGEGVQWFGYSFKTTNDSLIVVPGPNEKVGLINTRGEWLALPVFSEIKVSYKNQLFARLGNRYGQLEPNGIFHEPDSSLTDAGAHTIVRGINKPFRLENPAADTARKEMPVMVLDIYRQYTLVSDPSPGKNYQLIDNKTKKSVALPVRRLERFEFDFPFVRMKYYKEPFYREALIDMQGNLLQEDAASTIVVHNGDSTVIFLFGREWEMYDWRMQLLTSSSLMKLPAGDGQSISPLCKGFYSVGVIIDTVLRRVTLHEIATRNGRPVSDAIFSQCYYYKEINVEICDGTRAVADTAGNIYYKNDSVPHRVTRETLLRDRDYRHIGIEKTDRAYEKLQIKINPYCYDKHTFQKEGDWTIESWYYREKLVAQRKQKDVVKKGSANRHRPHHINEKAMVRNGVKTRKQIAYDYTPPWF